MSDEPKTAGLDGATALLVESVREIDDFRAEVEERGEGTDVDALWGVVGDVRNRIADALKVLGIDLDLEQSATPGMK